MARLDAELASPALAARGGAMVSAVAKARATAALALDAAEAEWLEASGEYEKEMA
jgi:hypothetical protein